MKKSFKKAGAAVLSMAMLLSMGAVSMPVFARDNVSGVPTNTDVNPHTGTNAGPDGDVNLPGSVHISMPGLYYQGEGDGDGPGDGSKYDYFPNDFQITSANVKVYRVATLDGVNGWKWESLFSDMANKLISQADADADANDSITDDNVNIGDDVKTFAQLLKRVGDADDGNFTTKSDDLKKLASYLERTITNPDNSAAAASLLIASKQLDYLNAVDGFELPIIDDTVTGFDENNIKTKDVIGYYIILTETDQAGVLVQPALISLKNGKENPKNISLKGSIIDINKKIVELGDDAAETNHSGKIIDDKSAPVAKKDVVHYEIYAQLPKYDPNVDVSKIEPFVIRDIATEGIKVNQDSIKVYVSAEDESDKKAAARAADAEYTKDNWYLTSDSTYKDYDLAMAADDNGFTITITGQQMRGENATTSIGVEDDTHNKGKLKTMENAYILVSFDATVDEVGSNNGYRFDRSYTKPVDYTETTLNANGANLSTILADYKTYINANMTGDQANKPFEQAVLNALATDKYSAYLTAMPALLAADTNLTAADYQDTNDDYLKNTVAMLLAIDHYNSVRNGEVNYAEMTYGNNYSTGGGKAKDITEDTNLYSVDISLNKYVEKLMLDYNGTEPAYANIAWEDVQAVFADTSITLDTTAPSDASAIDAVFESEYPASVSANDKIRYEQAAAYLLDKAKEEWNAAKHYNSRYTDEVVEGAIFKLVRDDGEVMGAAISGTAAQNGVLKQLTEVFVPTDTTLSLPTQDGVSTTAPAEADVKLTFTGNKTILVTENGENVKRQVAGTFYYTTATDVNAWKMLTPGTYTLTEEKAPTGFKKWNNDAPVVITIRALDDDGNVVGTSGAGKPDGAYSATGTSATIENIKGDEEAYSADYGSPNVDFKYYESDGTSDGVLTHKIYNQYQDELPATGGIGTVLFTAGGISVVLIAGALFVMYMKKKNSEEEE